MKIKDIWAREILDSRGNPTVEVEMELENGIKDVASVPSGASTGSREAVELRDNVFNRYNGKGVLKAIGNINEKIRPRLIGENIDLVKIDQLMLDLDGTENKSNLGANAIVAVSIVTLKCLAKLYNKELYEYVSNGKVTMPIPLVNVINGGKHAENNLNIQEFMIVPVVSSMKERVRCASEVFHSLKDLLMKDNLSVSVGDEGGFAPNLASNKDALDYLVKAISKSGYVPGKDVFIALDCAANGFYKDGMYEIDNRRMNVQELTNYYVDLINKYPILIIEDPFYEDDFKSLSDFTNLVGKKVMVVGDDYFVTNEKYLSRGIEEGAGNAILLKPNQIGTISEMTKTLLLAKKNNYKTIISHRSGETLDTYIADLAVGLCIPFIKTGSMSRGERICKYNRLMKIEELLNRRR